MAIGHNYNAKRWISSLIGNYYVIPAKAGISAGVFFKQILAFTGMMLVF